MTQPPGRPGRSGYGDDPYRPPGRHGHEYRPRHGHDDDYADEHVQQGYRSPAADGPQRIPPPVGRHIPGPDAPGPDAPGPDAPGPDAPGPHAPRPNAADPPPGQRRGATGMALRIAGVVLVLLLVAVTGFVLLGRDWRGTGAEARPSPTVAREFAEPARVVDRWLRAMFILKDPDEMLRFTCRRGADRAELQDAVNTVQQAEQDAKDADLTMTVSWSEPTEESRDETRAEVKATITWIVGEKSRKSPARFDLVFEAGWKVCASEMR